MHFQAVESIIRIMNIRNGQPYILIILLLAAFILNFFIFLPFIHIIVVAMVVSVVGQPLYSRILKSFHGKSGLAAFFTTLIVVILFLGPIIALSTQIFKESVGLYEYFSNEGRQEIISASSNVFGRIYGFVPYIQDISFDLDKYFEQALSFVIQKSGTIFSSLSLVIFNTLVFFVTLFYFLKDGSMLNSKMKSVGFVDDETYASVLKSFTTSINSVVGGSLIVAFIQGFLVSVGLFIFGVPNVFLWGLVAAFAALVPGLGTALVVVPAVIYLLIVGKVAFALGLLLWGMLLVGLIDNFLGPKLVSRKTNIHPAVIFFSVLGGVSFFGPSGFILGPLSASFLMVLSEIYISKNI